LVISADGNPLNDQNSVLTNCAGKVTWLAASFYPVISASGSVNGRWVISETFTNDGATLNADLLVIDKEFQDYYGEDVTTGGWTNSGNKRIRIGLRIDFGEGRIVDPSSSGILTIAKAVISETNKNLYACPSATARFKLADGCSSDLVWELSPLEEGGPWINTATGEITCGTNCGSYSVTVCAKNTGCADIGNLTVVGVNSLAPDDGFQATNQPCDTYVICAVSTNALVTNLLVRASTKPAGIAESNLPACWLMSGGDAVVVTNVDLTTNISRLMRSIDMTKAGKKTITCVAGSSALTNVVCIA
jgi:hypothetical protein